LARALSVLKNVFVCRVKVVLQYFDRKINENRSEEDRLQVMLLCGSDLLASFNTPGVWADEDVRS
jgi:nicotinic acid mononucleotide adenylyltransferase